MFAVFVAVGSLGVPAADLATVEESVVLIGAPKGLLTSLSVQAVSLR